MSHVSCKRCLAAAALALAGCAVGPDFVRPGPPPGVTRYTPVGTPSATLEAGDRAQSFVEGKKVAADWWTLFGSSKLDAVVAEALAANPGLHAAEASLRRSQNNLRAGYGVFFPSVDASLGAGRQRSNPAAVGSTQPAAIFNLFTLSGTVSYALDIWGGQRRAVEGLKAQVDAQRYTLIAATMVLTANVVNTVIAEAAYKAQIRATRDLVDFEKEQIRVTLTQVEAGTVPYASVLSLRSQLATTEAGLPALEQRVDQAEHLLSVLAGRPPSERAALPVALTDLTLPREVPVTLPAELIRRRPDVLLAEAQLHAASAEIGVATAAMLPNLTLSAGYGVASNTPGNAFTAGSQVWNVGAGITAPLFRGGTQWYQRKAAIDAHDQAQALYQQAVLSAFEQVADTLRALTHDAEALRAQAEAVAAAERALDLLQKNHEAGIATYLQVLVADGQYLQTKLGYVQAVAQRLQDTVALYLALGGGWWNAPKPIGGP